MLGFSLMELLGWCFKSSNCSSYNLKFDARKSKINVEERKYTSVRVAQCVREVAGWFKSNARNSIWQPCSVYTVVAVKKKKKTNSAAAGIVNMKNKKYVTCFPHLKSLFFILTFEPDGVN